MTADASFLLLYTLGSGSDDSIDWGPATDMGNLDSWLPVPALASGHGGHWRTEPAEARFALSLPYLPFLSL